MTSPLSFDPRPLPFAELLDRSFFASVKNARLLFVNYVIPASAGNLISSILFRHSDSGGPNDWLAAFVLAISIGSIPIVVASILTTEKMGNIYFGDVLSDLDRKRISPFSIAAIATTFVLAIFFLLGLIALVVPGIWIYVSGFLLMPAIVFDRVTFLKAFNRSRSLLKGRKLKLLLPLLAFIVADLSLDFGSESILGGDTLFQDVVYSILSSTLNAYVTVVGLFLYADARMRTESLDIDILAARVSRKTPDA